MTDVRGVTLPARQLSVRTSLEIPFDERANEGAMTDSRHSSAGRVLINDVRYAHLWRPESGQCWMSEKAQKETSR